MRNLRQYHRPRTLAEALDLLASPGAVPVAGGTQLMADAPPDVEIAVDLQRLPLRYVESDDTGLRIGTLTSIAELAQSPVLRVFADGVIAEAARLAATSLLRNQGTLAGSLLCNIANGALPPALLALDAEVLVERSDGPARLPLTTVYQARDIRGAILTEVRIPAPPAGARTRYRRVARAPADQAILTVTGVTRVTDTIIVESRVAAAGVGPRPMRLSEIEAALVGMQADAGAVVAVVGREVERLEMPDDALASAEYRRAVLPVLVRRAVMG